MYRIKLQPILHVVFFYIIFILEQCSTGKYYSDFKSIKCNIDTLAIVQPVIFLKSVNNEKWSEDSIQMGQLKKQICEKTHSILSHKYFLKIVPIFSDAILENDLCEFFSYMDIQDKKLSEIKTPFFMHKILKNIPERYCLMFFFIGYYNAYFEPYENIKQSLSTNTIYINRHLFYSDIRLVIVDNLKNNIVYYNKKISNINDPRIPEFIDQMTLNILRPIYYK